MSALTILNPSGESRISILKDPFSAACITSVDMHWRKVSYRPEPMIWAVVGFTNGRTEGKQNIEADSLDGLISKVEAFIKTVPK